MTDSNNINTDNAKEENMINYIKTLQQIEEAQEPFKEQKRDLKKSFIESGMLTREEISITVKAYRLLKDGEDVEQLIDTYSRLAGRVKINSIGE